MAVYTVHERPMPALVPAKRASDLVFVREGFSWLAFLVGGFWLLLRGLWLEFLVLMAASLLAAGVLIASGFPPEGVQTLLLFFNVFLGFELYDLQRWKLERQGYRMVGVVTGVNRAECERRFFTDWLPRARAEREVHTGARPAGLPAAAPAARSGINEPVIGFTGDWEAKA